MVLVFLLLQYIAISSIKSSVLCKDGKCLPTAYVLIRSGRQLLLKVIHLSPSLNLNLKNNLFRSDTLFLGYSSINYHKIVISKL